MATYIVKKGDNLSTIAKKFGMTEQELMKENNINPNRKYIYAGDAINVIDNRSAEVKASAPLPEVNNKIEEYIVQKGDTYNSISQKYKISLADLMELNNKDPFFDDLILPGDALKVIDRNHAAKVISNSSTDPKASTGLCPNAKKVGLFPVRYAVDENKFMSDRVTKGDVLDIKDLTRWKDFISNKGEKSLPKQWLNDGLPKLHTRAYTLRQLRKGWLYVWTKENGLEEYTVKPSQDGVTAPSFTKIDLKANKDKDIRTAAGEAKTLLEMDRVEVYLAYSSVQWTYNTCTEVEKALTEGTKDTPYTQWMRRVDLKQQQPAHTGSLGEIADVVADIYNEKNPAIAFSSSVNNGKVTGDNKEDTLVHSVADQFIQAKSKEDKNTDLFIALDDPLAIIDDLLLGLGFPVAAKEHYEGINQRKTQIAEISYPMFGLGIEEFMPEDVLKDPEQKYKYIKDIYTHGILEATVTAAKEDRDAKASAQIDSTIPNFGNSSSRLYRAVSAMTKDWGDQASLKSQDASGTTLLQKATEFDNLAILRRNYKVKESLEHLQNRARILKVYDNCIEKAVEDTIAWLDLLSGDAFTLCFDTSNEAHCEVLYAHALKILELLQNHGKGYDWFLAQYKKPTKIFGLSLFNFNQKLHRFFIRLAAEMSTDHNKAGVKGIQNDNTLASNIFTRFSDSIGILGNERLKKFAFFSELDQITQKTYEVLQKMGSSLIGGLYEGIIVNSFSHFAKLSAEELLPLAVGISLAPSPENNILSNKNIGRDFEKWTNDIKAITDELDDIKKDNIVLAKKKKSPINVAKAKANRERKLELEAKLETRRAEKPITFIAIEGEADRVKTLQEQAGQREAAERARQRLSKVKQYKENTKLWIAKNGNDKGSFLSAILVVWNIYNTIDALGKLKQNPSPVTLSNVASNIGYLGQAVMSLWMGAVWDRYYKIAQKVLTVKTRTNAVAVLGGNKILEMTMSNLASRRQVMATLAPKIISRIGVLNAFMGIGALAELPDAVSQLSKSSNTMETFGHITKIVSLGFTGLAGIVGGGNAITMLLFDCAWMMGTAVPVILVAASLAYLAATLWIMYFHREGIAVWLDECAWGDDKWKGATDKKSRIEELKALYKIMFEPTVDVTETRDLREKDDRFQWRGYQTTGFWLQLAFPGELKNETVTLKTLLVKGQGYWWYNTPLAADYQRLMNRIATDGTWSSPLREDNANKTLPENPTTEQRTLAPFDYDATPDIERYVYSVWIPYEDTGLETYFDLSIQLPIDTGKYSLMDAPGLETSDRVKDTLDYHYEHTLKIGFKRYSTYDVPPVNHETLKPKEADSVYINKPSYNKDTMTYTVTIGQNTIEQKS